MDPVRKRDRSSNEPDDVSLETLVDPDFEELARQFPSFGAAWRSVEAARKAAHSKLSTHVTQEFSVALTKALLHVHFGVSLSNLPLHHLCPPVPNRYFYVRWIQYDLLPRLLDPTFFQQSRTRSTVPIIGLDIGTGVVCIYPLLFCSAFLGSVDVMYATDIDVESVELAQANVDANPTIRARIRVRHVPEAERQLTQPEVLVEMERVRTVGGGDNDDAASDPLFPVGPLRRSVQHMPITEQLAFSMTNPPFYDNGEIIPPRSGDGRERTAMTTHEGCYPGGEVGFALDIILDSLYLHLQAQPVSTLNRIDSRSAAGPPGWSTTMCGKKSSLVFLQHVVTQLLGPAHVCVAEFGPGQLTRWFLAWTFHRPVARSPLAKLPGWTFGVALSVTMDAGADRMRLDCQEVASRIEEYCATLSGWELLCEIAPYQSNTQRLQIRESLSTAAPPWKGDEALPHRIQIAVQELHPSVRMEFLPSEGHILVDVSVIAATSTGVHVQVEAYHHSVHGRKVIEKIKSQLEGEVCRTNRRWRRRLQRQPMDESM